MPSTTPPTPAAFHILRLALGVVYFHFGFIKFFPDLSPAEMLATQTIIRLTAGWMDANSALFVLAIMECTLGVALIFNVWMRAAFVLFMFHMAGTFTPLFVLPELAFKISPLAPTFEGQYILKNIVFVAAGWAVFAPALFDKVVQRSSGEAELPTPLTNGTDASPTGQIADGREPHHQTPHQAIAP